MYFGFAVLAVIFGILVHIFENYSGGVNNAWQVMVYDALVESVLLGLIILESMVTARWNSWL